MKEESPNFLYAPDDTCYQADITQERPLVKQKIL